MKALFAALVGTTALMLLFTGGVGFAVADRSADAFRLHFALGLVTCILLIFTHVVTFTYFIVTGKLMLWAGTSPRVDAATLEAAKRLKRSVMRRAGLGIATIIVLTTTGALAQADAERAWWHFSAYLLLIVVNGWAFVGQYGCILKNGRLLSQSMTEYSSQSETPSPRSDEHPPQRLGQSTDEDLRTT